MKKLLLLPLLMAVMLITFVTSGPVFAHHAFASEFDAQRQVTLKGSIVRMLWVNPHGWLYIDATEVDGKPVSGGQPVAWALEFGSPIRLMRAGWRKDDLPVGAIVTVQAYRAKNGTNTGNANKVILSDGKELFAGSSIGDAN